MIIFVIPFSRLPLSYRFATWILRYLRPQCSTRYVQRCLTRLQAFEPGSKTCIQRFMMQFEPVGEQVRTHVSPFMPSAAQDL